MPWNAMASLASCSALLRWSTSEPQENSGTAAAVGCRTNSRHLPAFAGLSSSVTATNEALFLEAMCPASVAHARSGPGYGAVQKTRAERALQDMHHCKRSWSQCKPCDHIVMMYKLAAQSCGDLLRTRRLMSASRCSELLRNISSKVARLLNDPTDRPTVRNLFPSRSTAVTKRWCTSEAIRFLPDGSFCLISHDFRRACRCFRASLEGSSSKTRKASRTRQTGLVLRSAS